MALCAAVMTGQGAGAIATIELFGESPLAVLEGLFKPSGGGVAQFDTGRILVGHMVEGAQAIDQVTVGCEAAQRLAIHCHGNPLIVERLMKLLQDHGVKLVKAEQLRAQALSVDETSCAIATEAKLAMATVKTLVGARIVAHQARAGLSVQARLWQEQIESMSLDELKKQAAQILSDSDTARLIISGCTIALIGPPNTGKSTLLNALAGRDKALVTDVKGTTRDWVSAEIHIPPLAVTLIDTAGLDADLISPDGMIDKAAQAKSVEILQRADLVLLVLDRSRPMSRIGNDLLDGLAGKRVLVVLNKTDLPARLENADLLNRSHEVVPISARQGAGLDTLIDAIHRLCDVAGFDLSLPMAFTFRQGRLLGRLAAVSSQTEATTIIWELLEGPLSV